MVGLVRPTAMRHVVFLFLASCGGSDRPATAPSKAPNDRELPGTLDEAESELARATSDIQQATECEQLCRAFASMQRAQAALCVLTGEDDPRCQHAKATVEENAKRVAKCSCPP